jgi:hypothetical protein
VFDPFTLQEDEEASKEIKQKSQEDHEKFEEEKKTHEGEEPLYERSLYWSKDSKSGRTLENAPMFTEGTYIYTVST